MEVVDLKNQLVADILNEVADILEIQGVEFKPRAYRRAAQSVETMARPIEDVVREGQVEEVPGVGKAIGEKIEEIVLTGKLEYLDTIKKHTPVKVDELLPVEGLGPKRIKLFYDRLHIRTLHELKKAIRARKIRELPGMGEKSEQLIHEAIQFYESAGSRGLLGYMLPVAEGIRDKMRRLPSVKKAEIAGSMRRRKETVGDIDILVITKKPKEAVEHFASLVNVAKVVSKGTTRVTVRLKEGIECDLRVVPPESFGSALNYFTGSKAHNIALRRMAIKKGWKLSEYGLFGGANKDEQIAGKTEKGLYKKLGLAYIDPELRENNGELEAAAQNKLPKLVKLEDIRGDLQMHSTWSDGTDSIEAMAREAKRLGYEYISISDHVGTLKIAGAMDENDLKKQWKEIEEVEKKVGGIRILRGVEVNILADGKLDMPDRVLKEIDFVVASVHSGFRQTKRQATDRIVAAIENEYVDIIGHPTGRLIQKRKGMEFDMERVFDACKRTGTALEIDAYPNRLDLSAENARFAVESGVKLMIDTDAHSAGHLPFMRYGVMTARRGWVQKKDVLNTLPLKKLQKEIS